MATARAYRSGSLADGSGKLSARCKTNMHRVVVASKERKCQWRRGAARGESRSGRRFSRRVFGGAIVAVSPIFARGVSSFRLRWVVPLGPILRLLCCPFHCALHRTNTRTSSLLACQIWASTAGQKEINGGQEASSRVSDVLPRAAQMLTSFEVEHYSYCCRIV